MLNPICSHPKAYLFSVSILFIQMLKAQSFVPMLIHIKSCATTKNLQTNLIGFCAMVNFNAESYLFFSTENLFGCHFHVIMLGFRFWLLFSMNLTMAGVPIALTEFLLICSCAIIVFMLRTFLNITCHLIILFL